MTQVSATVVLDTIAGALVSQEKYNTKEEALRASQVGHPCESRPLSPAHSALAAQIWPGL